MELESSCARKRGNGAWLLSMLTVAVGLATSQRHLGQFEIKVEPTSSRLQVTALPVPTGSVSLREGLEINFPKEGWLYLEHLPLPGEKWPLPKHRFNSTEETTVHEPMVLHLNEPNTNTAIDSVDERWGPEVTIATGIPAILSNEKYFAKLMESIARQTVRANEVVLFMSNTKPRPEKNETDADTEDICRRVYEELRLVLDNTPPIPMPNNNNSRIVSMPPPRIRLRLACIKDRVTAGHARNAIERIASSDVVAFVDSDDQELPHRNALLRQQYTCFPKRVMVLGNLERDEKNVISIDDLIATQKKSCKASDMPKNIYNGTTMYDMSLKPRGYFYRGLGHGHMSVRRRAVLGHITHTSMKKSEDYTYIQDVLYAFGRNDDALIVLKQPMTTYYQRGYSTW